VAITFTLTTPGRFPAAPGLDSYRRLCPAAPPVTRGRATTIGERLLFERTKRPSLLPAGVMIGDAHDAPGCDRNAARSRPCTRSSMNNTSGV
jgi:hypothetical protein